jgi:hypothetical protein
VCTWTEDNSKVVVTLGDDAQMPANTPLDLNGDFLGGISSYSYTRSGSYTIILETVPNMPSPRVVIKAPRRHSVNFDLIIDASLTENGMFQNMTYYWQVESDDAPSNLLAELNDWLEPWSASPGLSNGIRLLIPRVRFMMLAGYRIRFICVARTAFETEGTGDSDWIELSSNLNVPSLSST